MLQVVIQKIPENLQEFEILPLKGGSRNISAHCFCVHWRCLTGTKMQALLRMNLLRGPKPMTPYDCQFLRDRLRGKVYLPLAYFEGATPENGYQPCMPYTLNVLADPRPQDIESGYMRVFLKTSGADSPRPMKLRQKASTGEWFLWEYSSILSGIRIPAAEDPWA